MLSSRIWRQSQTSLGSSYVCLQWQWPAGVTIQAPTEHFPKFGEQFESLPMGDLWEDAKLWEPIAYLLKSRRVRQDVAICVHQVFEHNHLYRTTHYIYRFDVLCRIPLEWQPSIATFWKKYKEKASLLIFVRWQMEHSTTQYVKRVGPKTENPRPRHSAVRRFAARLTRSLLLGYLMPLLKDLDPQKGLARMKSMTKGPMLFSVLCYSCKYT